MPHADLLLDREPKGIPRRIVCQRDLGTEPLTCNTVEYAVTVAVPRATPYSVRTARVNAATGSKTRAKYRARASVRPWPPAAPETDTRCRLKKPKLPLTGKHSPSGGGRIC